MPERASEIVLYCASGTRSVLAARSLEELGYTNVKSMAGGFSAWKRAGLPFDRPFVMTQEQSIRYSRHTMLPEIGEAGQIKLLESKVLCLGAGGLGSPAASTSRRRASARSASSTTTSSTRRTCSARSSTRWTASACPRSSRPSRRIAKLNPDVKVIGHQTRLDSSNVMDIIKDYDLIVDGADNFPTRYLVNDAALKLGKPIVHGSIFRFEGQVTSFSPARAATAARSPSRRRPTWRRRARRPACSACCPA